MKLMAHCLHRALQMRQRFCITPAEHQAQVDAVNLELAQKRAVLDESILALVQARIKSVRNCYEIKLTIDRAALESCTGEIAAINPMPNTRKGT